MPSKKGQTTERLSELSDDALDQAHLDAATEKDAARERAAAIQAERDRRAVQRKADAMSDEEKRELLQLIQAEGIETEEAVNGE